MRLAFLAKSVLALLLLTLTAAPVLGEEKFAVNPELKGEYHIMAQTLKMTSDQQTQLAALVKEKMDAATKWEADNLAAYNAAREKEKSENTEEAKQAKHDLSVLNSNKRKLLSGYEAKVEAILNPEQTAQWQTFKLNRDMLQRFSKALLTDEQKAQVKQMAGDASPQITKAAGDTKAAKAVRDQLAAKIHDSVLNEAQKLLVDAKETRHPATQPATPAPGAAPAPSK